MRCAAIVLQCLTYLWFKYLHILALHDPDPIGAARDEYKIQHQPWAGPQLLCSWPQRKYEMGGSLGMLSQFLRTATILIFHSVMALVPVSTLMTSEGLGLRAAMIQSGLTCWLSMRRGRFMYWLEVVISCIVTGMSLFMFPDLP